MADRMYAEIWIGGQVTPEQHKRLMECVKDECDDSEHDTHTGTFRAWADEASYGAFSDLEKLCREMNLPYKRRSEAKYEWDRCAEFWLPGMERPVERLVTNEGNVLVEVEAVISVCMENPVNVGAIEDYLKGLRLPTIPALVVITEIIPDPAFVELCKGFAEKS